MTPVERKVLAWVREMIELDCSLTGRDIARRFGFTARRASYLVKSLIEQGHLERNGRRRAISLPGLPDLTSVPTDMLRAELGRRGVTMDALAKPEIINWGRRAVTCAADCCQIEVLRGMLFCRTHWFALPRTLQDGIKLAFGRKNEAEYSRLVTKACDMIDLGSAA